MTPFLDTYGTTLGPLGFPQPDDAARSLEALLDTLPEVDYRRLSAVSDPVPANTTFVSFTQNTGPTFTCNVPTVGGTGTVSCSIASLAAGATATFTLVVNVNSDVVEGTLISNTASVSSATSDSNQANNSSTVTTQVVGGNPT